MIVAYTAGGQTAVIEQLNTKYMLEISVKSQKGVDGLQILRKLYTKFIFLSEDVIALTPA